MLNSDGNHRGRGRPILLRSGEAAGERWSPRPVRPRARTIARAMQPASDKDGPGGARTGKRKESIMDSAVYVGIDVAKAQLDIAVRPSGEQRVSRHDEAGIAALVTRLQAVQPALIVLEATGGREAPLAAALATAGLAVAVVNPRQVRDFARAVGQLAKTDALDAQLLARFAEVVHPTPRPLPDAAAQELSALLGRRRQLLGMLTAERQRLDTAGPAVRRHIQRHIAFLEQELADLDRYLHDAVQASPLWREQDDLLRSVPGIGATT